MPNRTGEPVNQGLEEIEDGVFKNQCLNCKHRQTKLVLVLEGNRRTQSFIGHCTNPDCFRFTKLEGMPSWQPA